MNLKRHLALVFLVLVGLYNSPASAFSQEGTFMIDGKFGKAADLSVPGQYLSIPLQKTMLQLPITLQCWIKINSTVNYNIIMAVGLKSNPAHWEIYTTPSDGYLEVYIPQAGTFRSTSMLKPDQWYFLALRFEYKRILLYVDGVSVLEKEVSQELRFDESPLLIGKVEAEMLGFDGAMDDLVITRSRHNLQDYTPKDPFKPDNDTIFAISFDQIIEGVFPNLITGNNQAGASVRGPLAMPQGNRFLDEVQDEQYAKSPLFGNAAVEKDSRLPVHDVEAIRSIKNVSLRPIARLSLDGSWLLKGSRPAIKANLEKLIVVPEESQGTKEGWFKYGYDRSDWLPVQVPTSVQNAMLQAGLIEDPFWDTNTWDELMEHGVPNNLEALQYRQTRIERQDWFFAKTFNVPTDWKDSVIRLYFDGIDMWGSFYLNGYSLGYYAGMFGGPEYDVSRLLNFDKPNELVVRIDAVPELWPGILKGSPGWGWHYGHMISLGIWRSVELQQVPLVEIRNPFIKTLSLSEKQAELEIEYDIESSLAKPLELQVLCVIEGKTFKSHPLEFANHINAYFGTNRYRTKITIDNPKLWWPLYYGNPDRYLLKLTVVRDGKSIHTVDASFGIRTVKMMPLYGAQPEVDYRWQFVINGVPMFIKGANWCWTDPMLQQEQAKYEHILELARRGGIQMLRAWGGGIIESDIFYEKCDEKGLMVYQEFPYCWGPPDFPLTDPNMLDEQVSRVVKRLRNRPSLIMWGGGNENAPITGNDEALLLVGKRCRQYDPSRPFHRTSPWGGSIHHWGVYHLGYPIESFDALAHPFIGEFGGTSMTNWDESLRYLPEEKLKVWPPDQEDIGVRYHMHNFGYGDFAKQFRYCDYGPINDWKTYIDYSQLSQGDIIRYACNKQRSGSYFNKGGLWFYKLTELFPGHSWGVVGYYGHPKLSYYQAKHAYAPQAAFAHYSKFNWSADEPFKASIHIANDSAQPLNDMVVEAVIYGSDLQPLWSNSYPVDVVPASTRRRLDQISVLLDSQKIHPFLMAVSLWTSERKLVSDQWYWFNYQIKTEAKKEVEAIPTWSWSQDMAPEAFRAYGEKIKAPLLELPRTRLSATLNTNGSKGILRIKNMTDTPAFMVLIDHFPHQYGNFLEDNGICLYPGQMRQIEFEVVDGIDALNKMTVRAWNADEVQVIQSEVMADEK